MTRFTVPDTVHATEDGNGDLVLLNRATGRWHKLNRTGTDFFQTLRSGADVEQAIGVLTERHPAIPPDRIRSDIEQLVATLVERGLLVLGEDRRSPGAVLMTAPAPGRAPRLRHRVSAAFAFLLALVLLRLPFRHTTAVVTRLRGLLARRTAREHEALAALSAAYWVSRFYPGRVACLEVSLTAVLTAALWRLRVDWCFGTAVDPQTFHAWIEVGGRPVTVSSEDPIPPTYRRVLLV
jgi:hypothetical protein